jgi:putative acetyltransferase
MPQSAVATALQIRPFQEGDASAFRQLNEHWIKKYFALEEHDHIALGDPENNILRLGGHIFMAVTDSGEPVGCCALIPLRPGVFELAKMAVAEHCRGCGIGRKLLQYTLDQAKTLGAKCLFLGSNTKLASAVHLYESVGFRHLPPESLPPSPYVRANVFMSMDL